MGYNVKIGILQEEIKEIDTLVQYRPQSEEDYKENCIPVDTSLSIAVIEFNNGYSFDVQLHGGDYKNDCAAAWIDVRLINAEGNCIGISEEKNTILGTFEVKDGGDVYGVHFVSHEFERPEKADELEKAAPIPTLNLSDEGLKFINRLSLNDEFDSRRFDREMEM